MISPSIQVVNGLILSHLEPIGISRTFPIHDQTRRYGINGYPFAEGSACGPLMDNMKTLPTRGPPRPA